MRWLAGCSAETLRGALEVVVPELSTCDIPVPEPAGNDPQYHKSTVALGDQFVVKFAWSRPAALQLAREIGALTTLSAEPAVPFLPEVAASSMDPLLLVTRRVPGTSLFDVVGSIDLVRLVVDFETIGAAEPEFDLRTFPGHGLARAHRPRRRGVAHRSRDPAGGPQDTAGLDR